MAGRVHPGVHRSPRGVASVAGAPGEVLAERPAAGRRGRSRPPGCGRRSSTPPGRGVVEEAAGDHVGGVPGRRPCAASRCSSSSGRPLRRRGSGCAGRRSRRGSRRGCRRSGRVGVRAVLGGVRLRAGGVRERDALGHELVAGAGGRRHGEGERGGGEWEQRTAEHCACSVVVITSPLELLDRPAERSAPFSRDRGWLPRACHTRRRTKPGRGAVWQRAAFGSPRSPVRIRPPRSRSRIRRRPSWSRRAP